MWKKKQFDHFQWKNVFKKFGKKKFDNFQWNFFENIIFHMAAIGIDLGTSYSCIGIFSQNKVDIIPNDKRNNITPTYLAFTDEEILFGDDAKNQSMMNQ